MEWRSFISFYTSWCKPSTYRNSYTNINYITHNVHTQRMLFRAMCTNDTIKLGKIFLTTNPSVECTFFLFNSTTFSASVLGVRDDWSYWGLIIGDICSRIIREVFFFNLKWWSSLWEYRTSNEKIVVCIMFRKRNVYQTDIDFCSWTLSKEAFPVWTDEVVISNRLRRLSLFSLNFNCWIIIIIVGGRESCSQFLQSESVRLWTIENE